MLKMISRLWRDEEGQGLVEYGLILALIAIVVIAALQTLGGKTAATLDKVGEELEDIPAGGTSL